MATHDLSKLLEGRETSHRIQPGSAAYIKALCLLLLVLSLQGSSPNRVLPYLLCGFEFYSEPSI